MLQDFATSDPKQAKDCLNKNMECSHPLKTPSA